MQVQQAKFKLQSIDNKMEIKISKSIRIMMKKNHFMKNKTFKNNIRLLKQMKLQSSKKNKKKKILKKILKIMMIKTIHVKL